MTAAGRAAVRFRVYLHGSGEFSIYGWTDTYDITGADDLQVIDWAQRQAGDSLTYAIALVYDDAAREQLNPGFGRGLVWLIGMDGNDDPTEPGEEATQQRMLARRRKPRRRAVGGTACRLVSRTRTTTAPRHPEGTSASAARRAVGWRADVLIRRCQLSGTTAKHA